MNKYLEYYNASKNGNLTKVLEDSFREDFYQGDQAFGCSSIGLDFDFTNNENVRKIESCGSGNCGGRDRFLQMD